MGKGKFFPRQVSSKSFVVQATCVSPESVEQAIICLKKIENFKPEPNWKKKSCKF